MNFGKLGSYKKQFESLFLILPVRVFVIFCQFFRKKKWKDKLRTTGQYFRSVYWKECTWKKYEKLESKKGSNIFDKSKK